MKISKEQKLYAQAMEHALDVVKKGGEEELEREVRYRQSRPVPLNVNRMELITTARGFASEELMIVATAMADTIANHLKLPPSVTLDYLIQFNKRVEEFHKDPDLFKKVNKKLESDYGMNETLKKFNMDEE